MSSGLFELTNAEINFGQVSLSQDYVPPRPFKVALYRGLKSLRIYGSRASTIRLSDHRHFQFKVEILDEPVKGGTLTVVSQIPQVELDLKGTRLSLVHSTGSSIVHGHRFVGAQTLSIDDVSPQSTLVFDIPYKSAISIEEIEAP